MPQRLEHRVDDLRGVEPRQLVHLLGPVLVDEDIRQHHGPYLQPVVQRAFHGQELQHMAAEAADRAFLDGDQRFVVARQPQDQVAVQRLGETGVGDGRRQSLADV